MHDIINTKFNEKLTFDILNAVIGGKLHRFMSTDDTQVYQLRRHWSVVVQSQLLATRRLSPITAHFSLATVQPFISLVNVMSNHCYPQFILVLIRVIIYIV